MAGLQFFGGLGGRRGRNFWIIRKVQKARKIQKARKVQKVQAIRKLQPPPAAAHAYTRTASVIFSISLSWEHSVSTSPVSYTPMVSVPSKMPSFVLRLI